MPDSPDLEMDVRYRVGTLDLSVNFATTASWTVMFGPSGSGKSTILRLAAGLDRPDEGFIRLDGQPVFDSNAGVAIPPHQRRMRWTSQRAMLFPRKTVRWNLAHGISGLDAEFGGRAWIDQLEWALEDFGLMELADRLPDELSGGQRQLVAVARAAIGSRGRLLLLDEPFTGLDAQVRDRLLASLRRWRGESPVISVTHDVGEAFLLGGEVIRIAEGRVVDQGSVENVLAGERKTLLAALRSGNE